MSPSWRELPPEPISATVGRVGAAQTSWSGRTTNTKCSARKSRRCLASPSSCTVRMTRNCRFGHRRDRNTRRTRGDRFRLRLGAHQYRSAGKRRAGSRRCALSSWRVSVGPEIGSAAWQRGRIEPPSSTIDRFRRLPEDSPKSQGKAACSCSIAIGRHHHNRAALDRGPWPPKGSGSEKSVMGRFTWAFPPSSFGSCSISPDDGPGPSGACRASCRGWHWPRPQCSHSRPARRRRKTGRPSRSSSSSPTRRAAAPTSSPGCSASACPSFSTSPSWSRTARAPAAPSGRCRSCAPIRTAIPC